MRGAELRRLGRAGGATETIIDDLRSDENQGEQRSNGTVVALVVFALRAYSACFAVVLLDECLNHLDDLALLFSR